MNLQRHRFVKLICGFWTHPCQELSFGGRNSGSIVKYKGKRSQQQKAGIAGSSLCEVNINFLKNYLQLPLVYNL